MNVKMEKKTTIQQQVQGITTEILTAAQALEHIGPAVSIFGSARISRDSPHYECCINIAKALTHAGFAIIAGGGPGIMEAANKGAFEAKGKSVGLNIVLPHEALYNPYQTTNLSFEYFYSRKATFFMHSFAYIAMPGGFGTLDELFEALTLIQTGKIPPAPIILVNKQFWNDLIDFITHQILANGMIAAHELSLFMVEDDPEQVVQAIVDFHRKHLLVTEAEPSLPTA